MNMKRKSELFIQEIMKVPFAPLFFSFMIKRVFFANYIALKLFKQFLESNEVGQPVIKESM